MKKTNDEIRKAAIIESNLHSLLEVIDINIENDIFKKLAMKYIQNIHQQLGMKEEQKSLN